MSAMRLASVSTRDVPGLPDVEVALQPVTALIGPRASGKSSLLRAVSWLLSGLPASAGQMAIRRAPPGTLTDEQRVRLEAEFDHVVLNAWRRFSNIAPDKIPPIFRKIVDRTIALANRGSTG